MGYVLAHPIDTTLIPTAELVGDVSALAFNADYSNQSAQRMDRRWQNLKNTAQTEYDIFKKGDLTEIAHELGGAATFFGGGAVLKGAKALGGAYQAGRFWGEIENTKNTHILASSPGEIAWGYGELSARQAKLLDSLPRTGRYIQLYKSDINVTDLAALTAKTGDEFALFTLGSQRLVVRGSSVGLEIRGSLSDKLLSQNYRWSAHTHPGTSDRVLMASGTPGDRQVLQLFNQDRSLILNSTGRRSVFDVENDYLITERMQYSRSPRL